MQNHKMTKRTNLEIKVFTGLIVEILGKMKKIN